MKYLLLHLGAAVVIMFGICLAAVFVIVMDAGGGGFLAYLLGLFVTFTLGKVEGAEAQRSRDAERGQRGRV